MQGITTINLKVLSVLSWYKIWLFSCMAREAQDSKLRWFFGEVLESSNMDLIWLYISRSNYTLIMCCIYTAQDMLEYGFSLICIIPYKTESDYVLVRKNAGSEKFRLLAYFTPWYLERWIFLMLTCTCLYLKDSFFGNKIPLIIK